MAGFCLLHELNEAGCDQMLMYRDIAVIVSLNVSSFGIDADDPPTQFAPQVLLAQLDHLNNSRPGVSTEPWHPALGGGGLGVLPLGALNGQCCIEYRGDLTFQEPLLASSLLPSSFDPCF